MTHKAPSQRLGRSTTQTTQIKFAGRVYALWRFGEAKEGDYRDEN